MNKKISFKENGKFMKVKEYKIKTTLESLNSNKYLNEYIYNSII